jgi:hypothetical protein
MCYNIHSIADVGIDRVGVKVSRDVTSVVEKCCSICQRLKGGYNVELMVEEIVNSSLLIMVYVQYS